MDFTSALFILIPMKLGVIKTLLSESSYIFHIQFISVVAVLSM